MAPDGDRPMLGLVVNPIAGLGARVGLHGTDGEAAVVEAVARGARPIALERARVALLALSDAWPHGRALPIVVTPPGAMGADALPTGREVDLELEVVAGGYREPTTAEDTIEAVAEMTERAVDLILFAGGDGTARDVAAALSAGRAAKDATRGSVHPVLGIPAGVKVQSAVFATSPRAAGALAARWLCSAARRTSEREIVDADDAPRDGGVTPRLYGTLVVPEDRAMQGRKSPSPVSERAAADAIARDVVSAMLPDHRYVLGPGTTIAAIGRRLGIEATLAGVDVVELAGTGDRTPSGALGPAGRVVATDCGEAELMSAVAGRPTTIVVTPIGGQGFLFGRGNQPISPAVIRSVGAANIMVVAAASKLAAMGGRPLLVDTGDATLDQELAGPMRVITGERDSAIVRVDPA
jgi:predicted polyphosphate/ATP-dependent NAD kinase